MSFIATDSHANTAQPIATVSLDHAPEGASASLYRAKKGCVLTRQEYYETAQSHYRYHFNKNTLLSARHQVRYYKDGGIANPDNTTITISHRDSTTLNIKDPSVLSEFYALKRHFNQKQLKACR